MLANPSPMQAALIKAALGTSNTRLYMKVAKAADKTTLKPLRSSNKLSFRTYQKLKAAGDVE